MENKINDICGAVLVLGDDYGDNPITFTCQKTKNHKGEHMETQPKFTISWKLDERKYCDHCNKLVSPAEIISLDFCKDCYSKTFPEKK